MDGELGRVQRLNVRYLQSHLGPETTPYSWRNDLAIARVTTPLVLVHGEQDEVIPAEHGRRLQALAPAARLVIVPGAGHNDLQEFPAYLDAVAEALRGR